VGVKEKKNETSKLDNLRRLEGGDVGDGDGGE
jgi:hypothetical protein